MTLHSNYKEQFEIEKRDRAIIEDYEKNFDSYIRPQQLAKLIEKHQIDLDYFIFIEQKYRTKRDVKNAERIDTNFSEETDNDNPEIYS